MATTKPTVHQFVSRPRGDSGDGEAAVVVVGTLASSMLTIILLVILAGGAGVVAISVAEKQHPATDSAAGHRGAAGDDGQPTGPTQDDLVDHDQDATDQRDREPDEFATFDLPAADLVSVPGDAEAPESVSSFDDNAVDVSAPSMPSSNRSTATRDPERSSDAPVTVTLPAREYTGAAPLDLLPRRADASNAPRRRVAVEGPLATVARRSAFRRLRAIAVLLTLSGAAGIALAATVGAAAVVVGSLLDRAIG